MLVSSFVTFNKRKNIKTCHFCVFSAFEKIFLNFFPVLYIDYWYLGLIYGLFLYKMDVLWEDRDIRFDNNSQ